ncbi:hypothetical protein NDU88_012328 [Pleurodeles waltl]|uniref:Uncharacterized protein n=1 Tax=Pleurodeles waltl TaxID=8319 RepID=A0AAV7QZT4_PLEWA|nr:hypothetical protein NDU88_012328 [Pleurodeles waltl]
MPVCSRSPHDVVVLRSYWELWKEGFEAYLDALDGDTFTHKKKFGILRHCLGSEDCLSRLPSENMSSEDEVGTSEDDVVVCSVESCLEGIVTEDEWKVASDADEQMCDVKHGLSQGWTKW